MRWKASPMALVAAAQAVTTLDTLPCASISMAALPAARLIRDMGMKYGEIRLGPRLSIVWDAPSIVEIPPIPEPMITPKRSRLNSVSCRPLFSYACFAAIRVNCVKRSLNFRSRFVKYCSISRFLTSPASLARKSPASKCVILSIPQREC